MANLKFFVKILKRFNLFDFILKVLKTTPQAQLIKELTDIAGKMTGTASTLQNFTKTLFNSPDKLAEELGKLSPVELGKLSEAIAKARADSGYKDKETGTESQALSSSWLIHGVYTPINDTSGTITITTINGKDYFFPKPIKYSTWERMKYAQGRNGTGAGQIFWDEYWFKLKGKQPKPGVATLFKLLEFRKRKARANKVVKITKRRLKQGRA